MYMRTSNSTSSIAVITAIMIATICTTETLL